jgi:hypothetical protein
MSMVVVSFIAGEKRNIVEAIQSSYKVIFVLTDHFVSNQWCKYEADQAIINIIKERAKNGWLGIRMMCSSGATCLWLRSVLLLEEKGEREENQLK